MTSLIWHSNAPWSSTGYGNQTALFAKRLAEHYRLSISAFYGLEANLLPWNGIPVLPGIGQTYGNETITEHAQTVFGKDLRKGLVVTLMDVWVLDPGVWARLNVASWVPVDHEPCPEPVRRFFEGSGAVPIAMSRFGERQLAELNPLYCPHAVDTEVYRPHPKDEARAEVGLPKDAFVVGMVAANKGNPSRKCFVEAFQAFKALNHPDAVLYLHTEALGRFDGVNLIKLADAVGIPRERVILCDQYRALYFPFEADHMAKVYSSMDVLLAASAGEGFGIPVIEAQACGVPVIVSDFSAQPELCGAGWIVEGTRTYTAIGSWQFRPSVPDIVEALTSAASHPPVTEKARTFALAYDIEAVMAEHMLPALEKVSERFAMREPVAV